MDVECFKCNSCLCNSYFMLHPSIDLSQESRGQQGKWFSAGQLVELRAGRTPLGLAAAQGEREEVVR